MGHQFLQLWQIYTWKNLSLKPFKYIQLHPRDYVDDTFVAMDGNEIGRFLQFLNSMRSSITFTMAEELENSP